MNNSNWIKQFETLRELKIFSNMDISFAAFICRSSGIAPDNSYPLYLAAALASNASLARKHICLDLNLLHGDLSCWFNDLTDFGDDAEKIEEILQQLPIPEKWSEQLKKYPEATGLVAADSPPEFKPLLLDGTLLYLYRDWRCERQLAEMIKTRCGRYPNFAPEPLNGRITAISTMFKPMSSDSPDWQQLAVFACLRNRFTVISGGPGTGKTTVAAAAAALMLELNPDFRIVLCAPTGKAKSRLEEALTAQTPYLRCSEPLKEKTATLPVHTIHRLLGSRIASPELKFNENRKLTVDVLIVDEASMISQSLMKALFSALPERARVILLGDMEQLASVESGMVLRDICLTAGANAFSGDFLNDANPAFNLDFRQLKNASSSQLPDCAVELKANHRFASDKGLGLSAAMIRQLPHEASISEAEQIISAIKHDSTGEISIHPLPGLTKRAFDAALEQQINRRTVQLNSETVNFMAYLKQPDVHSAFEVFNKFRILCVHRRGAYGALAVNQKIESVVNPSGNFREYHGKPIMITENSQALNLHNGDCGLIWSDERGKLKAFFPDREASEGNFRSFDINTLPPHETVFAMTVHKAQGSGFQNVLIILSSQPSPILTREMIYTAITRAEKSATIWGTDGIMAQALLSRTRRHSNLAAVLTRCDRER